jgi:DNA (cytosine-5)-methyltransferase 1
VEDAGRTGSAEAWGKWKIDKRTTNARLRNQIHWPTPTARDHKDGSYCPNVEVNGLLGRAVWPTPTATDEDGGVALDVQINNGQFFRENKNGVKWGVRLRDAIHHTNGGALNPTWVEWLMGFPDGWTDCGD